MKTLKIISRRNVLIAVHVVFMFASITLLSSCYATMDTPRPARAEIVISGHDRGGSRISGSNDRYERRRLRQERHHNQDDN